MIKKKSNGKKADTKTKKAKLKRSPRDKKIEKEHNWVKEFDLEFRNQFPSAIDDVDKYIKALEEGAEKLAPSFEIEEDTQLMKAYRYGWAIGWSEGNGTVLEKIKDIKTDQQVEEDELVNEMTNNKVFKFLEEQKASDPDRKIHRDEVLEASYLTREELANAGIQNIDRYDINKRPEQLNNSRFNEWWKNNSEEQPQREGELTYEDLDRYSYINFSSSYGSKFSDFDKFIKDYCFSRKRVGFWQTTKRGESLFWFDLLNEDELNAQNKSIEIARAKQLLEEEGIIERKEEFEREEPPEPNYS